VIRLGAPESRPLAVRGPGIDAGLAAKRLELERILAGLGRTLVAYSGGVDSSVLLVETARVLGDGAQGVIAKSPSLPARELEDALDLAARQGIGVRVIETHEMDREAYRRNASDRCFHCKTELFERLEEIAAREGWNTLAYGALVDDLGDSRPGMRAADQHRVRAPLLEAGIGKLEVRILARALDIRVWDKAASACLASRVPHGSEVTPEKLRQVEQGEEWLRSAFGLAMVRLRHEGVRARIEAQVGDIPRLNAGIDRIRFNLRDLGFEEVQIDPRGYRRPDPLPRSEEELADAQS
jgi:pyridinium-3,5-biscarboxylic acid mononucleotide sulfurtransferase